MDTTETETLREILDAEREASEIYDSAVLARGELDARITRGKELLKLKYADQVKAAVDEAGRKAAAGADAEIARLDAETDARFGRMQAEFERSRRDYIDRLFGLVIGDAG